MREQSDERLAFQPHDPFFVDHRAGFDVAAAKDAGVFVTVIGRVGGSAISGPGFSVELAALREASESFFRDWMEG